jgi:hypothetical protein
MAEQIQRSRGRSQNYKLDRGGQAAEFGPFYGIVKNTSDNLRSGRIQVYIPTFGDGNEDDPEKWTTVSYAPPYFGSTPYNPSTEGFGRYIDGNSNSYGMWFTPPDVGITVLCVFVNGDRSQGYYIGCVPDQSIGHMVPAIGATANFVPENENQATYFQTADRLPVVEINTNNLALEEDGRFFDKPKPIQSVVAETLLRQGLLTDAERGPISSSSQRESPSAVFGFSTPGIPVYQGGLKPGEIVKKVNAGEVKPQDTKIIGRTGGHSLVMDDGDVNGFDRLVRIRTTAGHQILMSDSGQFLYILHANGLTWIEMGKEGTVDVYAANSINLRTQGDFNVHADRDINMFAGRQFQVKAQNNINIQSDGDLNVICKKTSKLYSNTALEIKSDGRLTLNSQGGGWQGGDSIVFEAGGIDLNGASAPIVTAPDDITITTLDSTEFDTSTGWQILAEGMKSIVSRAPSHEPWPYHNQGVNVEIKLEPGTPTPPPGAVPVPAGVEIERTQ